MNTYWFYLRIKMFCISISPILLLKVLDCVNFITHNLNLLSYVELVGRVFAPLLIVFFIYKFAVKWLKYDTSPSNIYFQEHFNSISGKSYNILCFITNFLLRL